MCIKCGDPLPPYAGGKRRLYCLTCGPRRKPRRNFAVTCVCMCGDPIPPQSRGNPRRWCKETCRVAIYRRLHPKYVERQAELRRHPDWRDKNCTECGGRLPKGKSRYCSTVCDPTVGVLRQAKCRQCHSTFETTRSYQVYCKPECQTRWRWTAHPRPHKSVRMRILKRDGWICYLCRHPIDPSIRWPHPKSATVDHYIPYSVSKSNAESNLRAAHWACNEDKSDKIPGVELWVQESEDAWAAA